MRQSGQSTPHKWLVSQKIWSVEPLETLPAVQSQGHHTIDRLEERGVERGSARRWSSLKGREKVIRRQSDETVSKATLGKLLRDVVDHKCMGFSEHINTILNWTELFHSSGAVWESRWPSWAVRPNEPSGFRGRKELLNHALALVTTCP